MVMRRSDWQNFVLRQPSIHHRWMQHVRLQCSDTLIARGTKKGSRSRLMREEAAVRRRESTPALLLLRWRAVLREQGSGCRGLELSHLLLHGTGLAQCRL